MPLHERRPERIGGQVRCEQADGPALVRLAPGPDVDRLGAGADRYVDVGGPHRHPPDPRTPDSRQHRRAPCATAGSSATPIPGADAVPRIGLRLTSRQPPLGVGAVLQQSGAEVEVGRSGRPEVALDRRSGRGRILRADPLGAPFLGFLRARAGSRAPVRRRPPGSVCPGNLCQCVPGLAEEFVAWWDLSEAVAVPDRRSLKPAVPGTLASSPRRVMAWRNAASPSSHARPDRSPTRRQRRGVRRRVGERDVVLVRRVGCRTHHPRRTGSRMRWFLYGVAVLARLGTLRGPGPPGCRNIRNRQHEADHQRGGFHGVPPEVAATAARCREDEGLLSRSNKPIRSASVARYAVVDAMAAPSAPKVR